MNIAEIREKYPQYGDLSDMELATRLHGKFYSDMPIKDFLGKVGVESPMASGVTGSWEPEGFFKRTARAATKELPVIGAIAGTGAGLALGGPTGEEPLLAGLGAAGGKNIQQLVEHYAFGKQMPDVAQMFKEVGTAGAVGAASEMGGQLLVKGGQKVLAPFARKLSPEARKLAQVAREQKMPLSPSKIFPSKTSRAFEWVSEKIPPGGFIKSWRGNQLAKGLMRMHDDALGKLPVRADKFEAGWKLGEAIKGAKKTLQGQAKEAYKAFESGIEGSVNMSKTAALIKRAKEGATGELRAALEMTSKNGENWAPSMVDDFQKRIWSLTWKKDPGLGKKLTQAVKDDLGPGLTGLLENAKGKWQMLETFNKNPTVRQIMKKYATAPDEVIYSAFRSGNIEDIKVIKGALDKETWDVARSRFVENLLDASTDTSGQTAVFKPAQFVKLMDKYGRQIKEVMPEMYGNLKDFTAITKAAVDDMEKRSMSTFQKFMNEFGMLGAAGAVVSGKAPAVVVPMTFSGMMAKSLTNPKGWMKKWLTTGLLQGEGARQVMTQGARTAIMEGADND